MLTRLSLKQAMAWVAHAAVFMADLDADVPAGVEGLLAAMVFLCT